MTLIIVDFTSNTKIMYSFHESVNYKHFMKIIIKIISCNYFVII